ncbi:MAG: DHH family phosphoesterase [Candidatus Dojkabacteria bacterium]|nr:MAG: DHH family phosphoesterase [Candidatus Dojkabacteria bacterium]
MNPQVQKIQQYIEKSTKILIATHIRPDWDALASALLTEKILQKKYPNKYIRVVIEKGTIPNGEYLPGYTEILTDSFLTVVSEFDPDLIVITDCPSVNRISFSVSELEAWYHNNTIPIIAIDHHPPEDRMLPEIVFSTPYNCAVEEVYELFITECGYTQPAEIHRYLGAGILNDTNNFRFMRVNNRHTFSLVEKILSEGHFIDEIDRQITRYTPDHLLVVAEFLQNHQSDENVAYFWVTDEFAQAHPEISRDAYSIAKDAVNHYFLRNTTFKPIYLLLYPEGNGYKGSYRALINTYDVAFFAKKLGGGGQQPAAGFYLEAPSVETALAIALNTVAEHKEQAKIS